jgi:hypothetical protein
MTTSRRPRQRHNVRNCRSRRRFAARARTLVRIRATGYDRDHTVVLAATEDRQMKIARCGGVFRAINPLAHQLRLVASPIMRLQRSTTASLSMSAVSQARPRTAWAMLTKRSVKSAPRRLHTLPCAPCFEPRTRKPSCLISCSQPGSPGRRAIGERRLARAVADTDAACRLLLRHSFRAAAVRGGSPQSGYSPCVPERKREDAP